MCLYRWDRCFKYYAIWRTSCFSLHCLWQAITMFAKSVELKFKHHSQEVTFFSHASIVAQHCWSVHHLGPDWNITFFPFVVKIQIFQKLFERFPWDFVQISIKSRGWIVLILVIFWLSLYHQGNLVYSLNFSCNTMDRWISMCPVIFIYDQIAAKLTTSSSASVIHTFCYGWLANISLLTCYIKMPSTQCNNKHLPAKLQHIIVSKLAISPKHRCVSSTACSVTKIDNSKTTHPFHSRKPCRDCANCHT